MRPGQFPAVPLWWEIAYANGRRAKGTTIAEWIAAPDAGVLAARQPVERTYMSAGVRRHFTIRVPQNRNGGSDYYWLEQDGTINAGNARTIPQDIDPATVKRGEWIEREAWVAFYGEFSADVVAAED